MGQALRSAVEALRLMQRELQAVDADPARWRWVALGVVTALQGSLVAAMAGYETAMDDSIRDPSSPERIAPTALLLRRARSDEYLVPPERVKLTAGELRRIDRVIDLRNSAVHGQVFEIRPGVRDDLLAVLGLIEHLVIRHPAFGPDDFQLLLAMIADAIREIRSLLIAGGLTSK
ncbi:MAG: hypothetical protein ACK4NV_19435 [Pannonibacter sp.]